MKLNPRVLLALLIPAGAIAGPATAWAASQRLLNVSYSVTQSLFSDYDPAFVEYWKEKTGQDVTIRESYGGSGSQARAVIDGLDADVVSLSVASDINAIADATHLIAPDWQRRLADDSSPYYTVEVFLVRKGNPKHIRGWADLARPGVKVITPNPKTSGGARWNFLAAWGYGLTQGGESAARDYVTRLFRNVPVLNESGRKATTTFTRQELGDVLITYENEAKLAQQEFPDDDFQIVYPKRTIRVQPPVAVVDTLAERHGVSVLATAYLQHLYSPEAQRIIAAHGFRPRDPAVLEAHARDYPPIDTFTVGAQFGGWRQAEEKFFADGGVFDHIYTGGE